MGTAVDHRSVVRFCLQVQEYVNIASYVFLPVYGSCTSAPWKQTSVGVAPGTCPRKGVGVQFVQLSPLLRMGMMISKILAFQS